jgi:tetratricopeptide (TPR) repeat protein
VPAPAPRALLPAVNETIVLGGILLGTLLIYLRSLSNGFVFDDRLKIQANEYLGQWSFLWKSLFHDEWWFQGTGDLPQTSRYRPLSDIWFGVNFHLFGLNPAGWHLVTVAVHLVAVWLLFKLALRLTGDRQVSMLACLLFAMMPVHVQAVVWISAIGLLLTATFEIGALVLFASRAGSRFKLPLAMVLYAGALLSHESAVAFPALIGLYVLLFEAAGDAAMETGESGSIPARLRPTVIGMAPFIVLMLLYMLVRRLVLGAFINVSGQPLPIGAARVLLTVPRVAISDLAFMVAPSVAGLTHRQLFVTGPDSVDFVRHAASIDFLGPMVALFALAAVFVWAVRGHPRRRVYLFGAGWIAIAIAPMMNLAAITDFLEVQDDYLYLASAGWCVMFADWIAGVARAGTGARRNLVWSATAVLLAVYVAAAWSVQGVWRDNRALFARCAESFPDAPVCHGALGVALKLEGDMPGAERELVAAIRLDQMGDWTLPFQLAQTYARERKFAQAGKAMSVYIEMMPGPKAADYVTLAEYFALAGETAASEQALKQAESKPDGAESAALTRAEIRMWHGDNAGAEGMLRGLALRYPKDSEVWDELGSALADQKRYAEALSAYRQAVELEPRQLTPRFLIATLLHAMGRDQEALEQCRAALVIEPNSGDSQALMEEIERSMKQP